MKNGLRALALATAVLAAVPAAASADSIVFLKDYNVWLAAPDGSKLTQVTTDGTYERPYLSPSQADDGTIAVSKGTEIVRLRQNGEVINRLDPPPLVDSVSHPVDGTPVDVAISPDGTKIAWSFVNYSCPVGASCGARAVTGYTAADHLTPPEQLAGALYTSNPSWAGNARTLSSAGYGHQINVHDLGPGTTDVHWFDDQDIFPGASNTDLSDAELTRSGDKIALVRGYGDDTRLLTLETNGAPPALPRPVCVTSPDKKIQGPSWSPDGTALAVGDSDGITVLRNVPSDDAQCAAMQVRTVVPGGSEPDWGPAEVNPTPRSGPSPTPAPAPSAPAAPTLRVSAAKLRSALAKGLKVTLTGVSGTVSVTASEKQRVVARGSAKAKNGTAVVTVRFTKSAARRLKKLRRVTLSVRASGAPAKAVTLRR
jgi:pyruvate/2-oxoglutarate dehydrogenase complex dihydrolipoamide acyltransferase (E2) component